MVVREFPLSRIGKELRDRVEKAKKSEMKENTINNHTYFFRGVEHHEYKKAQEENSWKSQMDVRNRGSN
jgi:hypothetical protein